MKISTKLFFAVIVHVLVALVIGAALIFSYLTLETARDNGDKIRLVRNSLAELNHLIFAYVRYQEERPKQQFPAEHEKMTALLAGVHFRNHDHQRLLNEIRLNSRFVKDAFDRLVDHTENTGPAETERRLKYIEGRLAGQLLIKSHNADSIASILKGRVDADLARTQQRTFALIFLLLGFTTISVTVLVLQIRKRITGELTNLRQGTKIISSGNLDHVITTDSDDEIGDLTKAFNRMTVRLKEVTVSKAELEREVVERERAERFQRLMVEILSILNEPSEFKEAINRIINAIRKETGFDAVGIRLRSGEDIPYYSQEGFSKEFLLAENTLVVRNQNGGVCRDENGNADLECTCGLVLSGRTDPTNPLFTPGGSAWTNNSSTLLDLSSDQDPRLHPRNRCIHEGFLSVALIPIRQDQAIIGLLQLNDRKANRLTLDMIRFFEGVSSTIGLALSRRRAEEALLSANQRLSDLLASIGDAFFALDDELVVTYFNTEAERILGVKAGEVIGHPLFDTFPEARGSVFEEHYRAAIKDKKFCSFEAFFDVQPYRNWYEVRVHPHGNGISVFFQITTQRKEAEKEIRRLNAELEKRVLERTAELELLNETLRAENELRLESEIELRESEIRLRQLSTELLKAQEKERRLVARDIHDSIGSSLAAIKFKVEAALSQTGHQPLQQEPALKGVIPAIQAAIQETRRIQKDLRPPLLDDLGIVATIRWFCREFETTYTAVRIRQEIAIEEEEVPDSLKIVIFRVLQEALNNIAKYSGSDQARLSLRKASGGTELVIEDQGQGFDPKEMLGSGGTQRGLGLTSMRERTELSGGTFFIDSVKGEGTVIRAVWPV